MPTYFAIKTDATGTRRVSFDVPDTTTPLPAVMSIITKAFQLDSLGGCTLFTCDIEGNPSTPLDNDATFKSQGVAPLATVCVCEAASTSAATTGSVGAQPTSKAGSTRASSAKKLRFNDYATGAGAGTVASGGSGVSFSSAPTAAIAPTECGVYRIPSETCRSALKSSPTSQGPSSSRFGRRASEGAVSVSGVENLKVQVNPTPDLYIEPVTFGEDEDTKSPSVECYNKAHGSETASALADLGACGSGFRPMLLHLAAILLAMKPKEPDVFLVDRFTSHNMASQAGAAVEDGLSSNKVGCGSPVSGVSTVGGVTEDRTNNSDCAQSQQTLTFAPVGDTVKERLVFETPTQGPARAILLDIAHLLLDRKPDDPEHFLWIRMEGRSFGDEAAASNALLYAAEDGASVAVPEDAAMSALLREIPVSSPGYTLAVNLLVSLFAKKPTNPINYLYDHVCSRTRASTSCAQSLHSSARRAFDEGSYTSRELNEEEDDGEEDVDFLMDELPAMGGSCRDRRLSMGSAGAGSYRAKMRRRTRQRQMRNESSMRAAVQQQHERDPLYYAGARRVGGDVSGEAALDSADGDDSAPPMGEDQFAWRPQQQQQQQQVPSHMRSSYYPRPLHRTFLFGHSQLPSSHPRCPPSSDFYIPYNGQVRLNEVDYEAVVRDYECLRVREDLRLHRARHEAATLRRTWEYRDCLVQLGERESSQTVAAAAARAAMEEAERYVSDLEAHQKRLHADTAARLRRVAPYRAHPHPKRQQQQPRSPLSFDPTFPYRSSSPVSSPCMPRPGNYGCGGDVGVPSELDIMKKRVELMSMEEARAKVMTRQRGPQQQHYPDASSPSYMGSAYY